MKTKEEKLNYVQNVFKTGLGLGLFRTVKQWAELLGVDKSGLSSAMNGSDRNLTDNLVRKIEIWANENIGKYVVKPDGSEAFVMNLDDLKPDKEKEHNARGIYLPEETRAMYENMTETIRIQAEIIARMQAGTLPSYIPSSKNASLEKR